MKALSLHVKYYNEFVDIRESDDSALRDDLGEGYVNKVEKLGEQADSEMSEILVEANNYLLEKIKKVMNVKRLSRPSTIKDSWYVESQMWLEKKRPSGWHHTIGFSTKMEGTEKLIRFWVWKKEGDSVREELMTNFSAFRDSGLGKDEDDNKNGLTLSYIRLDNKKIENLDLNKKEIISSFKKEIDKLTDDCLRDFVSISTEI